MKIRVNWSVVLLFTMVIFPAQALADLALYDDFEAEFIDTNKWIGVETPPPPNGLAGEAVREIHGRPGSRKLQITYRAYGSLGSNVGDVGGRNRLLFANPAAVTAIEARIAVKKFEATGCAANPEPTQARARISGFFFRLPNPRLPDIPFTDVLADIRIVRFSNSTDGPNVLRVISRLFHCDDGACVPGVTIHSVDWGTIEKGERAKLRIQWDDASKTFISQRDDMQEDAHTLVGAVTFAGSKRLEISPIVPNCFGPPRSVSYTEAFFDNVRVNP